MIKEGDVVWFKVHASSMQDASEIYNTSRAVVVEVVEDYETKDSRKTHYLLQAIDMKGQPYGKRGITFWTQGWLVSADGVF